MAIRVTCPECSKNYQFGDDKAGRRFRCKECETLVDVPLAAEEEFLDELEIISDARPGLRSAGPGRTGRSRPVQTISGQLSTSRHSESS